MHLTLRTTCVAFKLLIVFYGICSILSQEFDEDFAELLDDVRDERSVKSTKVNPGSKTRGTCDIPNSPMNGEVRCEGKSIAMLTCTATCYSGFKFFDGTTVKKHVCNKRTGRWIPAKDFKDCQGSGVAQCDPPCQNGQCYGQNSCRCSHRFRGDRCQYDVSLCDGKRLRHNGFWACNHTSSETRCAVSCPPSAQFEYPPDEFYICDIKGNWMQDVVPKCIPIGCNPPCENGGECFDNRCVCKNKYRGDRCQYATSLCDGKHLNHNGNWACNHTSLETRCTVSCSSSMEFEYDPQEFYTCDVRGNWLNKNVPRCIPRGCNPPCVNGGTCFGHNVCLCNSKYRGDRCQYEVAACDINELQHNGNWACNHTNLETFCTVSCPPRMQFESPPKAVYVCDIKGNWNQQYIPKCIPISATLSPLTVPTTPTTEAECYPPCQNGGICYGNHKCVCTPNFRGDRCQYSVSLCDVKNLHHNGFWNCNHTSSETLCTVSCPPNMEFDYPAESIYRCDIQGQWLQNNIPNCVSSNLMTYSTPTAETPIPIIINANKTNGVCATWGQRHYLSLDGSLFSVDGKCTYLLLRDCISNGFSVHVKNDPSCNGIDDCERSILIYIGNDRYTLQQTINGPSAFWESSKLKIPTVINGLVIEQVAHYITVYTGLGFQLRWNGKDAITIEANQELFNKTCGMCGNFDGKDGNDFRMADGSQTTNIAAFANSWKMSDIGDSCEDASKLQHTCRYDSVDNQRISNEADEFCGQLLTSEYSDAHVLRDPKPYFEMCRFDFCDCGADGPKCACSSLNAYFQEIYRLGGKLLNGWRKPTFCPMDCAGDMIYDDCGSSCPATCKAASLDCFSDRCVDGCHCPQGTVFHNDTCIKRDQCPCYHNGVVYLNGETIQQDCNSCVCEAGRWKCTKETCEARCSAIGDPHYRTFDGRHYDFMGKCTYYLMKDDDFSIEQENVACSGAISENLGFGVSSEMPSCTKSVIIRTKNVTINLKQRKEVVVDGHTIPEMPLSLPGLYIYEPSSVYVKVELENGPSVTWDGQTRVYIDVPPTFYSNTKGLCGTYTNNQIDDFLTDEGDVEQNPIAFANKWKTSDKCPDLRIEESLQDPCELYPQRRELAQAYCSKLRSDIFSHCHDMIDPGPYYKDCMYDMCNCHAKLENCLCPTISNYAAECVKKNFLVNWRIQIRECGLNCFSGQVYQICGSSCKRSCTDIAYNLDCREQCVEGCNCPAGSTLNSDGECIPISSCPCIHGGNDFPAGYKDIRGNMTCECINARWECRPATNEELTSAFTVKPTDFKCSSAANMEYTNCVSDCPATCKNMHSPPKCDSYICKEGCRCKKGYVLDTKSSTCMKPTQCPCHHGGMSYKEGDVIQQDCNSCTCEGGAWKCDKDECAGICSVWGESHFKSFDGKMYEFHGDCDYVMARGGNEDYEKFQITIHNMPCGSSDITCSKSVSFRIGDEKVTLSTDNPLPDNNKRNGKNYILRQVGLYVFAHLDNGITLQWDKGTRVYVRADIRWKNKLEGLCGNFDGDGNNDFQTPEGGPPVVKSTIFGDSWRLRDYCPISKLINNTCEIHPERKTWATRQCSILKSALFRPCHSEVPYEPYFERCIFDSCGCDMGGDCMCFCTALSAYAHECNVHGVPLKWRTQELCPIQCDPCSNYTACMNVCPPVTCETQYIYKKIESSCEQESCIEGCKPKPCPPGEIFNNDREFKCVKSSECAQPPCKIINGRTYFEGETIKDPDVADPCQTCTCRSGNIKCLGTPCFMVTTTTPQVTPTTEASCEEGWTDWMNAFNPTFKNNGDYETLDILKKRQFKFCSLDNMLAVECRTAVSHINYNETGQIVSCSLPKGLVCENKDQPSVKLCSDYEIRVYCQCQPTTLPTTAPVRSLTCTAPGWTEWMNTGKPNTAGEYELLPQLRKKYVFCPDDEMTAVECRLTKDLHILTQNSPNVECSKDRGLVCNNLDGQICGDYEVRFYCHCNDTDCAYPRGMESGSIKDEQISVSSFKTPLTLGHRARLNGDGAWSAGLNNENQWIEVDLDEVQEITGIVTQGNPRANEWVTKYKIMFGEDGKQWTTIEDIQGYDMIFEGNTDSSSAITNMLDAPVMAKIIRLLPIEWEEWISLRMEILGCNRNVPIVPIIKVTETTTSEVTTTRSFTTISTELPTIRTSLPYECINGWTEWMNIDLPLTTSRYENSTGVAGDYEVIDDLRYFYSFCAQPLSIECRTSLTQQSAHLTGEDVKCDLNGLVCTNDKQTDHLCHDYEVRFYCECEPTSPITSMPTTSSTTFSSSEPCTVNEWTEWMDSSDPTKNPVGDMETLDVLRSQYNFCDYKAIIDVECRISGTAVSFQNAGQYGVVCDKNRGLQCLHSMQPSGKCKNYEIRFYCLCHITTEVISTVTTVQTITTEPYTSSPVETITGTMGIGTQKCNAWTTWINMDTPDDDGVDSELLMKIPDFNYICPKPVSFQCRDSKTKTMSYRTGQHFKERCSTKGIVCENVGQTCKDYEIRVFCLCPPPPPLPLPCIHDGWTDWFDTNNPVTGVGDFELIETLRKTNVFCHISNITKVECQASIPSNTGKKRSTSDKSNSTTNNWVDYTESGDIGVKCTKANGLICYNNLQANKKCKNYRMRIHCECDEHKYTTTTTRKTQSTETEPVETSIQTTSPTEPITQVPFDLCGWTSWMNVDNPDTTTTTEDMGDFETIAALRNVYGLCDDAFIKDIECRTADSKVSWKTSGQNGVVCDIDHGLQCDNSIQNGGCYDYEVRVMCLPDWCTSTGPSSEVSTILTTPPCGPGQTWSDCVYSCDQMCHSFAYQSINSKHCDSDNNITCIPGCVTKECQPPNVWRDENTCVAPNECTCFSEYGELLTPGEVYETADCERCQCIGQSVDCMPMPDCHVTMTFSSLVTEHSSSMINESVVTHTPPTGSELIREECWTEWINIASPETNHLGDFEDLSQSLARGYDICVNPLAIECRDAKTKISAIDGGQNLQCNLNKGLICHNHQNFKTSGCYDYEIRFFCPCVSTPPSISTVKSTVAVLTTERPCDEPMGVESGIINDQQITASTFYSEKFAPSKGRLNSDTAWVAKLLNQDQYLQFDFQGPQTISAVSTQGSGSHNERVTSYKVAYKAEDHLPWTFVTDDNGEPQVFSGNSDQNAVVTNYFDSPITATALRILPVTWHSWISMRAELIGCYKPFSSSRPPVIATTQPTTIVTTEPPCNEPMGVENGIINDQQITASTFYSEKFAPSKGRLNSDTAWAAKLLNQDQYLQFDFQGPQTISAVSTQGSGSHNERVTSYKVAYKTEDHLPWTFVTDDNGEPQVFSGNSDQSTIVTNYFDSPITATALRILPVTWHSYISMRAELIGCYKPFSSSPPPVIASTQPTTIVTTELPCDEPMGVESGIINDQQITASTFYSDKFAPSNGRLNSDTAWAAKLLNQDQYLQFDFQGPQTISAVSTQGSGSHNERVTSYKVAYKTEDHLPWTFVTDANGEPEVFSGNSDQNTVVTNYFDSPITATALRILPVTWHSWISMRAELLGCYKPYTLTSETPLITEITQTPRIRTETLTPVCSEPILKKIPIDQIDVSSSKSGDQSGEYRLFLNTSEDIDGTGGWVAGVDNEDQYILIKFTEPYNLIGIATQGRDKHPEWVKEYQVFYSENAVDLKSALDEDGNNVFKGNNDMDTPVMHKFASPIKAWSVLLVPIQWNNWISMRLDLYGCLEEENVTFSTKVYTAASTWVTSFNETQTIPSQATTEIPVPCQQGFTDWFSSHIPDRDGEYENVQDTRLAGHTFCDNSHITAMECRVKDTEVLHYNSDDRGVICNFLEGLFCENRNQVKGKKCSDYEIRFFCDCGGTTTSIPPTTKPTTQPSTSTLSTVPVVVTSEPCSYWSEWINEDKPWIGTGDIESRPPDLFCKEGEVQDIQCISTENGLSFDKFNGYMTCSVKTGFSCLNKNQPTKMCNDFKIRYFCGCISTTETTTPSTITPASIIIIVTAPPKIDAPCAEYYYIINNDMDPIPDSSLKASSSWNSLSGPQSARLHSTATGTTDGAWIPQFKDTQQYIQVDLGKSHLIYGIATQGHPLRQYWVTSYEILFSKDGVAFAYVQTPYDSTNTFTGNYDNNGLVEHIFKNPVEAQYVRIIPKSWENDIAIRFDIKGCSKPGEVTTMTTPFTTTAIECEDPMGVENGLLYDQQMTSSSFYDDILAPHNGRLNGKDSWAAKITDQNQYLEFNFNEPRIISGISTQGRSNSAQWVSSYRVAYSDGFAWTDILENDGTQQVFSGNHDEDTVITNYFTKPIRATKLRIYPQSWHNWISMRVEILGCYTPYNFTVVPTSSTPTVKTSTTEITPTITRTTPILCTEHILKTIPVEQIEVSSSKYGAQSGASRLLLDTQEEKNKTGGWVSSSDLLKRYITIDFGEPLQITGIITQGRHKHPEWVTDFSVLQSNNKIHYDKVKDEFGNTVFKGNKDSDTPVTNTFATPVFAQYITVEPLYWHNWASMRLEFLGCPKEFTTEPNIITMVPEEPSTSEITTEEIAAEEITTRPLSPACEEPIMKDLRLSQMKVSSTLAGAQSGVARLFLNTTEENDTGGWVAGVANRKQYIKIDFDKPITLTGIITQGRNKHSEWVTHYKVYRYSNDSTSSCTGHCAVMNEVGTYEFKGNDDMNSPVKNIFKSSIITPYIYIVPTKWHNWISMRLELLGCYELASSSPTVPVHTTTKPFTSVTKHTESPPPTQNCSTPILHDISSDLQIEVSSTFDGANSGKERLLLNTKESNGATGGWVAEQDNEDQYILITFGSPEVLTGIVTQGRDNNPQWVTEYQVFYSANDANLIPVLNSNGKSTFKGNEDMSTPVTNLFSSNITAKQILLVPTNWHNWISIRLELLGCRNGTPIVQPTISILTSELTTSKSSTSTEPTTYPTTEACYTYGPWLNLHVPKPGSVGDVEPIQEIIAKSNLCAEPIRIECRESVSQHNYNDVQQQVTCDLSNGLRCYNKDQNGHNCYNYEVRIACWTCPVTTVLPAPVLCPEVTDSTSCPEYCLNGTLCDGKKCVHPLECPCVQDGKVFKPGEVFETHNCEACTCSLRGHSYCFKKTCPVCSSGLVGDMNKDCECECHDCLDGEILCPTNKKCINESVWCDGVMDCPDDEKNCTTISPPTTIPSTACPPEIIPTCATGTILVKEHSNANCPSYTCVPISTTARPTSAPQVLTSYCEITHNYINTFDGFGYEYDICDHILLQDKEYNNFNISVYKNCSDVTGNCGRYIEINQDDQTVRVNKNLEVEMNGWRYDDSQLTKLARKFPNLTVRIRGQSAFIKSQKYHYEVTWNSEGNINIGVTEELFQKVNGLCGYFNKDSSDDKMTADGLIADTVTKFGDSWSLGSQDQCTASTCPAEVQAEAIAACNELLIAPFDACHSVVDPSPYIQACRSSICDCMTTTNHTIKECRCKAYLSYVEACEMKNIAKIRYWRVKQSCLPNCPPGLVWHDCGSICERSCDNLQDYITQNSSCDSEKCVAGCFCPAGMVRKGDHCVEPEKCQDCVCKGYGDPHYYSYDGLYFPFQGNCTYILSRDILTSTNNNHKFEVYGTNEDCHEEPMTTCTVAIMVLFNSHIAHFRINESVTFDGVQLIESDFPFHAYGIHIESIPGRSVTFTVPEVYLEVRYFELNYGFEIRLPSEVYYNRTEGLCGNCNFNTSDDLRCQNGTFTNDTNEFGLSWVAVPPEGFESVNEICVPTPIEDCPMSLEQEMCDRLLSDEFIPCHALEDPENYLKACRYDACHSINPTASVCRAIAEYARVCAEVGICIEDWRTDHFCPYECPPRMQYQQCGPKCPRSCKDINPNSWALRSLGGKDIIPDWSLETTLRELNDICDSAPVDGCFCMGDLVFMDGDCVDPTTCETCDDGKHKVGETWQTDVCTSCTCTSKLNNECTKIQCPPKPTCSADEVLKVVSGDNITCCDNYVCSKERGHVCPPLKIRECRSGEELRVVHDKATGCSQYECKCDITLCPPLKSPTDLQSGEEVETVQTECCPKINVVCKTETCPPKPICNDNYTLKVLDNPKSSCCREYRCVPPPEFCLYNHEYRVTNGKEIKLKPGSYETKSYNLGDIWMDGLCRKCTCESRYGYHRHRCTIEICPRVEDYQDHKDYVWNTEQLPSVCCPKFTRVQCIAGGKNYTNGQEWASPDGDKCKRYRCNSLAHNEVIRIERQTTCFKNCSMGSKYVEPPESSPNCCGKCEPFACIEEGQVYDVGDMWNSTAHKCFTAKCIKKGNTIQTHYFASCPKLPINCTKKEKDANGCCDICTETGPSLPRRVCQPQKLSPYETIKIFSLYDRGAKCTNDEPILNMMACVGMCSSKSTYSPDHHNYVSDCKCCTPSQSEKKIIYLSCTDNKRRPIEYTQPTECSCTTCSGGSIPDARLEKYQAKYK